MQSRVRAKLSSSRWVRKRSDIDIMASILSEALKDAKKTHVMYRCNLSHRQLEVYLKLLLGMRLLASHAGKDDSKLGLFRTTAKGREFLDAYRTLRALMA